LSGVNVIHHRRKCDALSILLAAVLVNNQTVFTIVLVQMLSIAIISLIVLLGGYGRLHTIDFVRWVISEKFNDDLYADNLVMPLWLY
jgi:hypothetical protein